MSKFLFVSTYDLRRNTSGNIRTVALMNSLHDRGHEVHCIFVPTNNVSDKSIYSHLVKINKIITFPKIEMNCITASSEQKTAGKTSFISCIRQRLINMYSRLSVYDVFSLSLLKLSKKDLADLDDCYDYIVSSSEPRSSHKFAEKIIALKHYKTKWVLYWGDPMSNDVASNKLFGDRERKEEHRLISVSDYSVYTNPCAVSYMKDLYPKLAEKISWIPTTDFKHDNSFDRGELTRIGYFGDYRQMYRNIYPFYEACSENSFSTVIIGGGDIELLPKGTVEVYGRMTRDQVSEYEQKCGILVVLENISKTGNCIQVPGKLYHYGLTHKYILVITESSNIASEYEKYNRFVFVPNDKDIIADAIKSIQSGQYSNMNIAPVEAFQYERIANDFISIIQ